MEIFISIDVVLRNTLQKFDYHYNDAYLSSDLEDTTFEYGLIDEIGWIWSGPNGTFTVKAGEEGSTIKADGMVIPAFGEIDLEHYKIIPNIIVFYL